MKKFAFNVISTATLMATAVTPVVAVVAPIAASAATNTRVSEVPTYSNDKDGAQLATLSFQEDSDYISDLKAGGSITLTFPSGAKVTDISVKLNGTDITTLDGGSVDKVGDYTVNIKLPTTISDEAKDKLDITPTVNFDGFTGSSVDVDVQSFGAGISAGKYTLAQVASGDTVSTAIDTKTVGEDGGTLGTLRIEETSVGKIEAGHEVSVKLPQGFKWTTDSKVAFVGGLATSMNPVTVTEDNISVDGRTLKFTPVASGTNTDVRGYIQITPDVTVKKSDAHTGDISVSVSGDDVSDADVVVGTYSDYAIAVTADGDAKQVVAGRDDSSSTDDQKLQKLVVKETVPNSIAPNRKSRVDFPSWVKITGVKITDAKNVNPDVLQAAITDAISGKSDEANYVEFEIKPLSATEKVEFKAEFRVSTEADKTGDITATVSGRQGLDGTVTLGKAVAPVSVTATSNKLVIGKKNQAIGNITITENVKGAIQDGTGKKLVLSLPDGLVWNDYSNIKVTSGDLVLDTENADDNGTDLWIPIKSESTKASTITISGATIDVDRTIPEGPVNVKVKGNSIVTNYVADHTFVDGDGATHSYASGDKDEVGLFDVSKIGSFEVGNVATPAPGTTYANTSFTIGKTTYSVNGVEKTLDVAPYTKAGQVGSEPWRSVSQGVDTRLCLPKTAWPPTSSKLVM